MLKKIFLEYRSKTLLDFITSDRKFMNTVYGETKIFFR